MSTLGFGVLAACALVLLTQRLWPGEAHARLRQWALILVSGAVVAHWQRRGLVATLALTGVTWLGLRLAQNSRRWILGGAIVVLVAALVGCKYGAWLLSPWPAAMHWALDPTKVPVGLSFTVFRLTGVLLDAVNLRMTVSGGELLVLALFFPTYRSGPITTLQSFGLLAAEPGDSLARAARRILVGLCRKILLANNLATLVLNPWLKGGVAALAPEQCLLLPVLFGLRVYWDFAGYTDIAIGTAALLGYRVPENFDRPYLSRSIVEFWRRWHITLSEWIRLRLFMKMAGRRAGKGRIYLATLVSMALCGLWHGAGLGFLLWGVWHGLGIVATHLFGEAQRQSEAVRRIAMLPGSDAVATGLTFTYVSLGWLLFFLPLGEAGMASARAAQALATPAGAGILAAGLLVGLVAYELVRRDVRLGTVWARLPAVARGVGYALLAWALIVSAPEPFIYFRF